MGTFLVRHIRSHYYIIRPTLSAQKWHVILSLHIYHAITAGTVDQAEE